MKKVSIIFVMLLVLATGCGARKVAVNTSEQSTKIDSVVVQKEVAKEVIQNNIVTNTETQEIEVTPIDSCKEVLINNIPYKNARITIRNIKTKQTDKTTKKAVKTKRIEAKKAIQKKVEVKQKEVDRKQSYYWLLIIPFLWLVWKYKWEIAFIYRAATFDIQRYKK